MGSPIRARSLEFTPPKRAPRALATTLFFASLLALGWVAPVSAQLSPVPALTPTSTPTPEQTEPPKLSLKAVAFAPEHTPVRPVQIDVTVVNFGRFSCREMEIALTTEPEKLSGGSRPYPPGSHDKAPQEPTVLDPHTDTTVLDELYAGRSRTLHFSTPFYSASGFRSDHGFFLIENLIPNLRRSVVIHYRASVSVRGKVVAKFP